MKQSNVEAESGSGTAFVVFLGFVLAMAAAIWAGIGLPKEYHPVGINPFRWSLLVWLGLVGVALMALAVELFGPRRFGSGPVLQRTASRTDGARLTGPRLGSLGLLLLISIPIVNLATFAATVVASGQPLRILAVAPLTLLGLFYWGVTARALMRVVRGKA